MENWLKSVSAFANGTGGVLVFGTADDGTVAGAQNMEAALKMIRSKIEECIVPLPQTALKPRKQKNGKELLLLEVSPGKEPPYYYITDRKRGAYIRSGKENIPAGTEELKKLLLKAEDITCDARETDYPAEGTTFAELGICYQEWTGNILPKASLETLGLIKNNRLTFAGLLFADTADFKIPSGHPGAPCGTLPVPSEKARSTQPARSGKACRTQPAQSDKARSTQPTQSEKACSTQPAQSEKACSTQPGQSGAHAIPDSLPDLRCIRWKGLDRSGGRKGILAGARYKGNLFTLLNKGIAFIKENMKIQWEESDGKKTALPDYPDRSIFEGLVNALAHRDYLRTKSEIRIDIYDNRLTISSPGGMADGSRIQDKPPGIVLPSVRNPVIAGTLTQIGYMDQEGTGLAKIQSDCQKALRYTPEKNPFCYSDHGQFTLTLKNLNYPESRPFPAPDTTTETKPPQNNTEPPEKTKKETRTPDPIQKPTKNNPDSPTKKEKNNPKPSQTMITEKETSNREPPGTIAIEKETSTQEPPRTMTIEKETSNPEAVQTMTMEKRTGDLEASRTMTMEKEISDTEASRKMTTENNKKIAKGNKESTAEQHTHEKKAEINNEKKTAAELTDNEKKVLAVLAAQPAVSTDKISQQTGIAKRTVERTLQSLKKNNHIIRQGSRRSGTWHVVTN